MSNKTIEELLPEFYEENNLGAEGGMNSSSVRIEMAKNLVLYFPNFSARRKAVLKHDIHHLITDYPSTFTGETEISAWEIASGCKKYWAAWVLDISGMMMGIFFNFWGVLKAFARGRRTKNLYFDIMPDEQAMKMKPHELKGILLLDKFPKNVKPSMVDLIFLLLVTLLGIFYTFLSLLLLPFVIVYTIYTKSKLRLQTR